jgi:hypothetical protein
MLGNDLKVFDLSSVILILGLFPDILFNDIGTPISIDSQENQEVLSEANGWSKKGVFLGR